MLPLLPISCLLQGCCCSFQVLLVWTIHSCTTLLVFWLLSVSLWPVLGIAIPKFSCLVLYLMNKLHWVSCRLHFWAVFCSCLTLAPQSCQFLPACSHLLVKIRFGQARERKQLQWRESFNVFFGVGFRCGSKRGKKNMVSMVSHTFG